MGHHYDFGDERPHWRAGALPRRVQRERFERLVRLGQALRRHPRSCGSATLATQRRGPTCRD
jgi:hypothetical protein